MLIQSAKEIKLRVITTDDGSDGKESACSVEDQGLSPGSGRFPGEGNGYPLQYSCLDSSTHRGALQATAKSWTRLSN